jgi:hypothetical protein
MGGWRERQPASAGSRKRGLCRCAFVADCLTYAHLRPAGRHWAHHLVPDTGGPAGVHRQDYAGGLRCHGHGEQRSGSGLTSANVTPSCRVPQAVLAYDREPALPATRSGVSFFAGASALVAVLPRAVYSAMGVAAPVAGTGVVLRRFMRAGDSYLHVSDTDCDAMTEGLIVPAMAGALSWAVQPSGRVRLFLNVSDEALTVAGKLATLTEAVAAPTQPELTLSAPNLGLVAGREEVALWRMTLPFLACLDIMASSTIGKDAVSTADVIQWAEFQSSEVMLAGGAVYCGGGLLTMTLLPYSCAATAVALGQTRPGRQHIAAAAAHRAGRALLVEDCDNGRSDDDRGPAAARSHGRTAELLEVRAPLSSAHSSRQSGPLPRTVVADGRRPAAHRGRG